MTTNEEASSRGYVLSRNNSLASARLNIQHWMWKEVYGYLLHPSIPRTEGMKVCDVGTGTGIWAVEVARGLPASAEVTGFDVSLEQAPPAEWLPPNIKMETLDAFAPVPDHLVEAFDVVNLRLLMCVVKNDDPSALVQNMKRMLKPGGYLQWGEYDLKSRKLDKARTDLNDSNLHKVAFFQDTQAAQDARMLPSWPGALGEHFRNAGLRIISDDKRYTPPELLPYQCDGHFMTWREFGARFSGDVAVEFQRAADEAEKDVWAAGRGMSLNMQNCLCIGQKSKDGK